MASSLSVGLPTSKTTSGVPLPLGPGGGGTDDCASAEAIAGTGTFNFDNSAATIDGVGDALCDFFSQDNIDNDVWFCWTSDCDGQVTVQTCGLTAVDTKIAAYDGCGCPSGSAILDCNDDACGGALQSSISFTAVNGNSYLIRIGTFPGETGGTGQFAISCQTGGGGNDDCANAEAIAGVGTFDFDNSNALTDGNADALCLAFGLDQIDNDVWFCWTSDCDGVVQVETCGLTGVDTKIAAYDGCTCPSGSGILACNDDSCGGALQSRITFLAVSGNTYLIRIGTFPGEVGGTGQFAISCLGPPEPTPCDEPPANCQAGDLSDAASSLAGTFEVADDFNLDTAGSITSICWWGTYASGTPSADSFTVTYFDDAGGLPGAIIGGPFSGAGLTVSGPVDTGSVIAGVVPEFEYKATHAAVAVSAGCHWVSVTNALGGDNWFWELGVGNGRALQDGQSGGTAEPVNGFDASDVIQSDLKWCLDVAVGDPGACLPPPAANDDCANAEAIAGVGTYPFDNSAATTDGLPDALCDFFGLQDIDNDVWFCWTSDCDGVVQVETCGLTGVDTKIAAYDGCTCPSGSGILACNDDSCGGTLQSRITFLAVSGNTYLIRIGTFPGEVGGVGSFAISCLGPPPELPCDEPAANCQAGDLSDALTSTDGAFAVADDFNLDAAGNITSICWWGTYNTGVAGIDDFTVTYFDDAGGVPGAIIGGPFSGAGLTVTGPVDTGNLIAGVVPEFEYTATHAAVAASAGCHWISITNGITSDTWFWEIGVGNGRAMQDGTPPNGFDAGDAVLADTKWCLDVALGDATACLPPPAANNDCGDAEAIVGDGVFPFDNSAATADGLDDVLCDAFGLQSIDNDVWFCWTAPCDGTATVQTCGLTGVDTKIAAYDGCTCPTGNGILACNDDTCSLQSQIMFPVIGGQSYLLRIGTFPGAAGGAGSFSVDTACSEPTGACCGTDGGCAVLAESNCDASGGVFLGDGTDCGNETQVDSVTSSPAVAIPDNDPLGVSDTLNVGSSFSIEDVNISLDVTHTFVGDLIVTVEHLGTTVTIVDRSGVPTTTFGCGEDNLSIVLDDEGTGGAIEDQCSPGLSSPPNYTPFNPLSAFDGLDSAGNWTITISDNAAQDTGTLDSWTVSFNALGASPCGNVGACCDGATCTVESDTDCAAHGGVFQGTGTDCGAEVVVASPSSSPAVAIPDNDPLGVSDTINVGSSFSVYDLNVAVAATHTWVGDLIVTIEHNATSVTIMDRAGVPDSTFGCSEDNLDIVLDDEGTGGAIENQCAADLSSPPNYTPNNPLSAFDSMDSAGDWTITVSDNAGGDTGTLDSWSLIFSAPGESPCEVGPACTPDDCPPDAFALVDNQTGVFSGWCVTTPNLPDVDIFVDTVDLVGDFAVIQIVKSFRNPPDPTSGLISPILLNFVQVCDDTDTVSMIIVTEEAINNLTGVEWTDYHWTLFTTPVAWFDVDGSSGFNISPFATKQFKNFLDSPTNNKAKDLDVFGGGTVSSPGGYFPGFGTGGLKIGVDLSGGPVSFTLKQRPTVPPPAIEGACCTNGVCAISTDVDCDAGGGTFLGEDTECATCFACGIPPASNDLCADAISVDVPSQTDGSTIGATVDGLDFCGTSNTAPGVWYSVIGTGNTMTATTCNECSDFDTKLSVFCAGCDVLNCVGGNDDDCDAFDGVLSTVTWCSESGVEYLILVHGFSSSEGNFRLDISDDGIACTTPPDCAPPPVCTPDFVVMAPGTFPGDTTDATDDCDVFGSDGGDHIYEVTLPNDGLWTFTLCGSTFDTKIEVGTTCCSADVGSNDDDCGLQSTVTAELTTGTYYVTVDGFDGDAGAYTLDISKEAAGSNDDCANATPLSGEGEFGFDNSMATADGPADPACDFFGHDEMDNDVWFCWTATCDGTATVETCDLTSVDTKIAAWDGCTCPPTTILACNDDACSGNLQSSISFSVVAGNTYLIEIGTFAGASGGTGSFSVACTAGGLQVVPPFVSPSLDIKPGMVPNPFAKDSNGVVPMGIMGTVDFDVTAVDISTIRVARMDRTGGLVAPYQGTAGPQTSIGEIGTPDGFADLSVNFKTSELASALKLGEIHEGSTVELLITGSRVDGSQFKAVDSMTIAPLTKGQNLLTATSNVADVWMDASEMDVNGDVGGFANFARWYDGQVSSVTLTAPSSAGNDRVFSRWILNGVPQTPSVRSIEVVLGGQQTLEARYIRPRRVSPGVEIQPGPVGSPNPLP